MTQFDVEPETRARVEALTQEIDVRDYEYWEHRISKDGWVLHYGDQHHTKRPLPYAMAAVNVYHKQGCDWFHAPLGGYGNVLDYAVTVFSDEIRNDLGRNPFNRQEDGNTYVYQLYPEEHQFNDWRFTERDYTNLPGGTYKLVILIPLFKLEKVVSIEFNRAVDIYRVSTSQGVYEHTELEAKQGFIGLLHDRNSSGYCVWKLIKEATNIDEFHREMYRRALVMNVDYEDSYAGFATDNTRPNHDNQRQALDSEQTEDMEQDDHMKEGADNNQYSYIEDWLANVEPEDSNSTRIRSRHDPDALWVHRPGRSSMKY